MGFAGKGRFFESYEMKECFDRCEAQVAGCGADASFLFKVIEKCDDERGGEIAQCQTGGGLVG